MSNEVPDHYGVTLEGLDAHDEKRARAYARDLDRGLRTLRTFPQGVGIFGSARLPETGRYYAAARKLGQKLAENKHTVVTGGGPGIMEAAARGAFEKGGRSVGLNITLTHEQRPNPYLTDMIQFEYFFARKVMLMMACKAYVFFPGGFGTLDEFSEVLILMQEGKMPKMPLFLYGKSFWTPLHHYFTMKMRPLGVIAKPDTKIYKITNDIDEIVAAANKLGYGAPNENLYDDYVETIPETWTAK